VGVLTGSGRQATGAHLFQTDPSANFYDYYAMAIGARSQSAKTYLEKHFAEFADCACGVGARVWAEPDGSAGTAEELMRHALWALRETAAGGKLEARSTSLALVGKVRGRGPCSGVGAEAGVRRTRRSASWRTRRCSSTSTPSRPTLRPPPPPPRPCVLPAIRGRVRSRHVQGPPTAADAAAATGGPDDMQV
jgi:hypothetical protein